MNAHTNTQLIRTTKAFAVATLVERIVDAAAGFAQRVQDRRGLSPLLGFSDHELKDIGLSRGDVEREITKPLFWRIGG